MIFASFRSTELNLSALQSQGLIATPIDSVDQKSVISMGAESLTFST